MLRQLINRHKESVIAKRNKIAKKALEKRLLESSNSFGTTCNLAKNGKEQAERI